MTAAAQLRATADKLNSVSARVLPRAVQVVVDVAADEARRATGDGRMSGMGRRGPRLRAVPARPETRGTATTVVVRGIPAGPWSILSTGARPHSIRPRRRGPGVMAGGLRHPTSRPVRHGGTRGKGTWARVIARAEQLVPGLFEDDVHRAVS